MAICISNFWEKFILLYSFPLNPAHTLVSHSVIFLLGGHPASEHKGLQVGFSWVSNFAWLLFKHEVHSWGLFCFLNWCLCDCCATFLTHHVMLKKQLFKMSPQPVVFSISLWLISHFCTQEPILCKWPLTISYFTHQHIGYIHIALKT